MKLRPLSFHFILHPSAFILCFSGGGGDFLALQLDESGGRGGEPRGWADAAARAGVNGGAGRGRARDLRARVLTFEEGPAHAGVNYLPRQRLVVSPRTGSVKRCVNSGLAQRPLQVAAAPRH